LPDEENDQYSMLNAQFSLDVRGMYSFLIGHMLNAGCINQQ